MNTKRYLENVLPTISWSLDYHVRQLANASLSLKDRLEIYSLILKQATLLTSTAATLLLELSSTQPDLFSSLGYSESQMSLRLTPEAN